MARYAATARAVEAVPPAFRVLIQSFRRHRAAENKAPRTVQTYAEGLCRFAEYLAAQSMPIDPAAVSRRPTPPVGSRRPAG